MQTETAARLIQDAASFAVFQLPISLCWKHEVGHQTENARNAYCDRVHSKENVKLRSFVGVGDTRG